MIFDKNEEATATDQRWFKGDVFGLEIPSDRESLLSGGTDFLTKAFQCFGSLAADNRVVEIIDSREFVGGGTGKKLLLTVGYENPAPELSEKLFIKFSRNFDNELWDRGRHQMISEANFAVLSRSPDFPVAVPHCMFADIESNTASGLIITECINYGEGNVEVLHPKCMDYNIPDQLDHYKAILKGLARLSGMHKAGRLNAEFDRQYPYDEERAKSIFGLHATEDKLVHRANKMFDFVVRYPKLFPDNVRSARFHKQFVTDLADLVQAENKIRDRLFCDSKYIAFAHWNANIDNCWFWRDAEEGLQAGFMDWANVSQINIAQSISGAISGAEPHIWNNHLDELLQVYIDEFAVQGGPKLSLENLRLQSLLIVIMSGAAFSMAAPIAIGREIEDIDALDSYQDEQFWHHENARIQLHMMTKMLNVWETRKLGDVIRGLE